MDLYSVFERPGTYIVGKAGSRTELTRLDGGGLVKLSRCYDAVFLLVTDWEGDPVALYTHLVPVADT